MKIHKKILEFAKSEGYTEPISDQTREEAIRRLLERNPEFDRADAELDLDEMEREDIEDFFDARLKRKRNHLKSVR